MTIDEHAAGSPAHARRGIAGSGRRRAARVLIAGSGVAALETMLALHDSVGASVDIALITPDDSFAYRPLSVAEPFGMSVPHVRINDLLRWRGVRRVPARVASVDPSRRRVRTDLGQELEYDFLVVATGAARRPARPGALTIGDPADAPRIRQAVADLEARGRGALVFMVPGRRAWALPVYESAVMTAARLRVAGCDARLTVVSPERAPMEILGARAGQAVEALLRDHGIGFRGSTFAMAVDRHELSIVPGRPVPADAVISVPELVHAAPGGLPGDGPIPADAFGRIDGRDDLYVVGEASALHVGHGGVAAQQADAAASAIAAAIDGRRDAEPFRAVVRAALMTPEEPIYLRAELDGRRQGAVATRPLWWPPVKIAGRHLGPALDKHGVGRLERAGDAPRRRH